ncbi:MAG: hypothetical protein ACFCUS_05620 [Rubrimonas sp.]|uniref:hypothetical protein n=1 Tax=Rubrimonas sp. TaxID=2036015 RepID=UPI002FDDFA04
MRRQVSYLALAAALAAAALAAPDRARAAEERFDVETYSPRGESLGREPLYDFRRALLIVAADARSGGDARAELSAWLEASGFRLSVLDFADPDPETAPPPFRTAAADWLAANDLSRDALLLVIVDGPLRQERRRDVVRVEAGNDAAVDDLLAEIERARARHAVVAFTAPVENQSVFPQRLRTDAEPLGRDATRRARVALWPRRAGEPVLTRLSDALRGDPGPGFDPDAYVSVADLARLSPGLDAGVFGYGEDGGAPVLALRQGYETAPGGGPDRREAYRDARDATRAEALERFAALQPQGARDGAWAAARLEAVRRGERRAAARRCDAGLAFDAEAVLGLGVAVVGRLGAVDRPDDLARDWLGQIARATGVDPARASDLLADCARAGADAPERALRVATLSAGRGGAGPEAGAPDGAPAPLDLARLAGGGAAAATLAGLVDLAAGTRADRAQRGAVAEALRGHAFAGDPAAQLVHGLTLLAGDGLSPGDGAQGLHWIGLAAEAGLPLARAVRGVALLSDDPRLRRLREGVATDAGVGLRDLRAATRRGLEIAPRLLDLAAMEELERREAASACEARLGFDPAALWSAWNWRSARDFADVAGAPGRFLARALEGAALGGWRETCAKALDLEAPPLGVRLRVAAAAAAEGDLTTARRALRGAQDPTGLAAFALATLIRAEAPDEARALVAEAVAAGLPEAILAQPRLFGGDASGGAAAIAHLAEDGPPAAAFAMALEAARGDAPFDALRAHLWAARAAARGFAIEPEALGLLRETAALALPGDLGLALAPPTRAALIEAGHFAHPGEGVMVLGSAAGSPAEQGGATPGMVIAEFGRGLRFGADLAAARSLMLDQFVAEARVAGLAERPGGAKKGFAIAAPPEIAAFLRAPQPASRMAAYGESPPPLRAGPGPSFAEIGAPPPGARARVLAAAPGSRWLRVAVELGQGRIAEGYATDDALLP